jgi:predicted phosphodiesterase
MFTSSAKIESDLGKKILKSTKKPGLIASRIGLIGDVHAEEGRLAAALDWLHAQGAEVLLCTGDVADGPGSVDTCCELLRESGAITVRGNHDRWLLQDRVRDIPQAHRRSEIGSKANDYLESLSNTQSIDTPRGALLLCHGVEDNDLRKVWPGTARMGVERSAELDEILAARKYRFVVNGHMHYRVLIDFPEMLLINAGTLSARHRPGISLIDFEAGAIAAHEFDGDRVGGRVAEHPILAESRRVWPDTKAFDGSWTAVALYGADPG